jgi:AraC family transcriptional regulator
MDYNEKHKVEVRDVPKMHVVYIRHIGPYKGDAELFKGLFNRLFTWAGAHELLQFPRTKVLTVYHDNPDVTDDDKLRTSVCITVPENTPVEGEVGAMDIPAGKYAIGHFEIEENGYERAWDALYGVWLTESGYQPEDRPPFELYLNDPKEHPEHKHIVDIYMPVKPM